MGVGCKNPKSSCEKTAQLLIQNNNKQNKMNSTQEGDTRENSVRDVNHSQTNMLFETPAVKQSAQGLVKFDNKTLASNVYPDSERSLKDWLGKSIPVATYEWSVGTDLNETFRLPEALNAAPFTNLLNYFAFLNGGFEVAVQLSSTPFHAGRLRLSATPIVQLPTNELVRASVLPGVWIDACDSRTTILSLPFAHVLDMIQPGKYSALSQAYVLRFHTYSQLTAPASSAQTVHLAVTVRMVDAMVRNPIANTGYIPESGALDDVMEIVPQLASKALPILADAALPGSGSLVSTGIKCLTGSLDNPNLPGGKDVPKSSRSITHATGGIASNRMDYSQSRQFPILEEDVTTKTDEMDLSYMTSMYSYYKKFTLSTTDVVGALRFVQSGNPGLFNSFELSATNIVVEDSLLSHISRAFFFFRGGIKVRLSAVCTKFHKARLLIAISPSISTNVSFLQARTLPHYIWDIQEGSHDIELEIPYMNCTRYAQVENTPAAVAAASDVTGVANMLVYVMVPLANGGDTSSTIDILCHAAGAEDFQLATPGDLRDYKLEPTTLNFEPESGLATSTDFVRDENNATSVVTGKLGTSHNSTITHLTDLLKRPMRWAEKRVDMDTNSTIAILGNSILTRTEVENMLQHFAVMYRFQHGPLRHLIVTNASKAFSSIVYYITETAANYNTNVLPLGSQPFTENGNFLEAGNLTTDNIIDITNSWMSVFSKVIIPQLGDENINTGSSILRFRGEQFPNSPPLYMYFAHALADETRFSYIIGPPTKYYPLP